MDLSVPTKLIVAGTLVLFSTTLVSARSQHWHDHRHHVHAHSLYAHRVGGFSPLAAGAMSEPMRSHQTYAGYELSGYGGVPEDPLIPIRPVVSPPIYHSGLPCYSLDDCDRKDYDKFGTRGRLGLGASPLHPEGPGNPSY